MTRLRQLISRPSIRLRLALWCAGLVTLSGVVVVVGVLALTGSVLHDRARTVQPAPLLAPPPGAPAPPAGGVFRHAQQQQGDVVGHTLYEARTIGLVVVLVLALASIGIGWTVSGRMLRPVQDLAQAAHAVSETSLDRRIARDGPRDELQSLADAFDAMLDRLQAAFTAQRRFVADASHELRTPMATIRAETDSVLLDPNATPAGIQAAAERISLTLDRGDALVEALLTLSRSDAITARQPADLAEVARDVVTSTPGAAQLELELALDPAPVTGDPALLDRLAANLVENAVRYNRVAGRLAVSTSSAGGVSELRVANDGPLIDPGELPALTERFHRRESDRRRAAGGFGLGLAIADAIARGHGGTLSLSSRPQGGLEARVTLPAAP